MAKNSGGWEKVSEKTAYKGRVHIVEHIVKLPDGSPGQYEIDHSDGYAVAVLVKTPANEIILTHQYRYPIDRWIYDLPGGGANPTETPEQAAARECTEEVGLVPKKLEKLITFYANPGRSDWPVHLFFCNQYEEGNPIDDDPSEVIERIAMPIAELDSMIRRGEIIDPSLLIAWHTAKDKGYLTS